MIREADGFEIESKIRYGTDVVEAIHEYADDIDASAIAFTSRGTGSG